jgi:oxygen-independent coproporphyrinogen-3 oxidase
VVDYAVAIFRGLATLMKLLFELADGDLLGQLDAHIANGVSGDYIYSYPPRQSYVGCDETMIEAALGSLESTLEPLNLYLHVPFCRQICSFCNLYATPLRGDSYVDHYLDTLIRELRWLGEHAAGRSVATLYVGGGTPSIATPAQLGKLLAHTVDAFDESIESIAEVALEVAPDTVDLVRLRALRDVGFTRVNMGVQSTSSTELISIGRRHGSGLALRAVEAAMDAGFQNVCVDLIYGLPEQTFCSWQRSVATVANMQVPTVCAYPLTSRPYTGYARSGHASPDGPMQYAKYDEARATLLSAGYRQETHVRYSLPGGGYLQKARHWAGEDILGAGAGARSYLASADVRNPYSIVTRRRALNDYVRRVEAEDFPLWTSGVKMSADERVRKSLILQLLHLDVPDFEAQFGVSPMDVTSELLEGLAERGLLEIGPKLIALTDDGVRYRDLIVQLFFSSDVRSRVAAFDYRE